MQHNYIYTDQKIQSLFKALSETRLSTYLILAGQDRKQAILFYYWNMQLSQSLYLPLQILEVVIRNTVAASIERCFGQDWYLQARFTTICLDPKWAKPELDKTLQKVQQKKGRQFN